MASSWKGDDLLDVELASTNLGSGVSVSEWGLGGSHAADAIDNVNTYDFSEVLTNLLDNKNELLLPGPATPSTNPLLGLGSMVTPTHSLMDQSGTDCEEVRSREQLEVVLKAPSAYGIKADQERVTYLNRGYSYEIQFQHLVATPVLYKSTLSLSFCELRWQNGEREHFEQWSRDHPQERLLQIDSIGCAGMSSVDNDECSLNRVHFTWCQSNAVLAVKINCLSTEFAAKKHGGEKGVPLRLHLEMQECEADQGQRSRKSYQGTCGIKVFKDKGGDRKQRQDQAKMEKLSPIEQVKYRPSEPVTHFMLVPSNGGSLPQTPFTSQSDSSSTLASTPGASPYALATPPSIKPAVSTSVSITSCVSVEDTQRWLMLNRFSQYCSLFINYTGSDLLCMNRQDLIDLCGHADGIRLYNSVQSRTLKTLYVRFKAEDKVYQAVCLEELTAQELLMKLLDKLAWLDVGHVVSFVRLTSTGLLVRIDDTVVYGMLHEDSFLLQTIKEENGSYQVVLQDCVPPSNQQQVSISLSGSAPRH